MAYCVINVSKEMYLVPFLLAHLCSSTTIGVPLSIPLAVKNFGLPNTVADLGAGARGPLGCPKKRNFFWIQDLN